MSGDPPHPHPSSGLTILIERNGGIYHVHVVANVDAEFTVPWSMLEERGARPLRRGEKAVLTLNGAVRIERRGEGLVFEPILMAWPLTRIVLVNHGDYVDVGFNDHEEERVVLPRIFAEYPAVPWSEIGRHVDILNVKRFAILLMYDNLEDERSRVLYADLDYGVVKIKTSSGVVTVKTAYPVRLPLGINRYQVLPLPAQRERLIEEVQMELDTLSRRIENMYEDTLLIIIGGKRLLLASQQNRRFDVALPRASAQPVEAVGPIYHVSVVDDVKPSVIGYGSWH